MDNSNTSVQRSRNFHLSIRDLLALAAIVALALSLYVSNAKNAQLKDQLNVAFPGQLLRLHDDHDGHPPRIGYSLTSNIAMTGMFHTIHHPANATATVSAKMLDPKSGEELGSDTTSVNPNGNFHFTIKHGPELEPGFYPVLVEISYGSKPVAHTISLVKLVDVRSGIE